MKPKVSIVVPIYGVEKYLNQCVDSILAQTLKEIEVILVDDGSKDNCPQIVDEYAQKDSRVVAIHQPNGGYGRAVNHGIEVATGEYIGIIESDDWIEPTMYEKLYNNARKNDTDITKCMFYTYNSKLPPQKQNKVWKLKWQDLAFAPDGVFNVVQWPLIIAVHASIWANLYRSEFIKEQKVIETRSASYQDFPFMIEAMCRARRISVVKEPLVHYRMEEGQDSSTIRRDERLILMPKQCLAGKKILQKYRLFETLKEEFYYHAYVACIGFYKNIYWKYKKEYLNVFSELFSLDDLHHLKKGYFGKETLQNCIYICKKELIRSLWQNRCVRRFLFSIHKSPEGWLIQFLGVQIAKGKYTKRPAFIKFRIGS